MLTQNLPILGSPTRTFNLRTINPNGEVLRADPSASLTTPRTLLTSSVKKGSAGKEYQRVFVRFDYSEGPDVSGFTPVVSGHVVFNVPLTTTAPTRAEEIRTMIIALMTAANLTSMLNGEV